MAVRLAPSNFSNPCLSSEIQFLNNLFCSTIQGSTDPAQIQACANSIALIARRLSQDPDFLSPFARSARSNGFHDVLGGKEDDITVLLATVRLSGGASGHSRLDREL